MILVPAPPKRCLYSCKYRKRFTIVCTTSTSHSTCFGQLMRGFWNISIRPFASHLGFLGNGINAMNTPALPVGALFKKRLRSGNDYSPNAKLPRNGIMPECGVELRRPSHRVGPEFRRSTNGVRIRESRSKPETSHDPANHCSSVSTVQPPVQIPIPDGNPSPFSTPKMSKQTSVVHAKMRLVHLTFTFAQKFAQAARSSPFNKSDSSSNRVCQTASRAYIG